MLTFGWRKGILNMKTEEVGNMNTKQIQYVLALSETLNFSQAAERMGISQPALSKQIQYIEKEFGVKLFDRNHSPLTMTPAFVNDSFLSCSAYRRAD